MKELWEALKIFYYLAGLILICLRELISYFFFWVGEKLQGKKE